MARIKYFDKETGTWKYADSSFSEGGGGSGNAVTPELLYEVTAENVTAVADEIDLKGHNNFSFIVTGTKKDAAITITTGHFYMNSKRYTVFYYTAWLDASKSETDVSGSVHQHFNKIGSDIAVVNHQKFNDTTYGIRTNFQGGSSTLGNPKEGLLKGNDDTKKDGIDFKFSAEMPSVTVQIYGW